MTMLNLPLSPLEAQVLADLCESGMKSAHLDRHQSAAAERALGRLTMISGGKIIQDVLTSIDEEEEEDPSDQGNNIRSGSEKSYRTGYSEGWSAAVDKMETLRRNPTLPEEWAEAIDDWQSGGQGGGGRPPSLIPIMQKHGIPRAGFEFEERSPFGLVPAILSPCVP